MTKLVIVGTIHQSSKHYSTMDLFNALEQIRPEIIFEELPPELHTAPELKELPFDEELEDQEGSAIKWYFDKYHVPVIPVDLPNRNQIYSEQVSAENYKNAYMFLRMLLTSNKLKIDEAEALRLYFEIVENQRKLADAGSINDINSEVMDELVVNKHRMALDVCIPLLTKYSGDRHFAHSWRSYEKWFEEREKYMVGQILGHLNHVNCAVFPVGADHRIGLHKRLKSYSRLY
jgi:pheromone shutdown protein TraB